MDGWMDGNIDRYNPNPRTDRWMNREIDGLIE